MSPARQRRRERRKAARVVEEAAVEEAAVEEAAVKATANEEDLVEKATESDNPNETSSNTSQVPVEQAVAETVSTSVETESGLFVTDIDDEICDDEQYYEELDPGEAFTCFQCKIEHYPDNYVNEGQKLKMYGLCRWHLGVLRCKNCSKNLIGLGTVRVHRQLCRAPS